MDEKVKSFRRCKIIYWGLYEILKTIPDKTIDLILTDPPYNISNILRRNIHYQ